MNYRSWTFKDILKISELEKECFSEPWTYRMFADAFSSKGFVGVLAEEEGEIVGYACGTAMFETAEIDDVAVAEGYRRQGIAAALLGAMERESLALGAETLLLEVRVSNSPAMRLYLKEGFSGLYARPRYYPDGEDALVMRKLLGVPQVSRVGTGRKKPEK